MAFFQSNIHLGEVGIQLLAFLIVFWTLKSLAWKPLMAMLDARSEKIRAGLASLEESKKEVETLKAKYEESRAKIEEEAREKIQQAVTEGKRVAREIQDGARNEARSLLDKAKEDLALEVAKAKVTLRNEITDLTLASTERLVSQKMDAKRDRELVLEFIEKVERLKQ